jgi:hypothetical protein
MNIGIVLAKKPKHATVLRLSGKWFQNTSKQNPLKNNKLHDRKKTKLEHVEPEVIAATDFELVNCRTEIRFENLPTAYRI